MGVCPSRSAVQKPTVLKKTSSSYKVGRSLVTLFEVCLSDVDSGAHAACGSKTHFIAVANCHLTAEPKPKDRVSTVEDSVKVARKLYDDAIKEAAASAPKGQKQGKKGKGAEVAPLAT